VLLLEHEGKAALRGEAIAVPRGAVVARAADVAKALREITPPVMVKAQILAGGRGKAGGIVAAEDLAAAGRAAGSLLGSTVKGHPVETLLIEERLSPARERYLATMLDGERMLLLFGEQGGVEVETFFSEGAATFYVVEIDPVYGLGAYQVRKMLQKAGIPARLWGAYCDIALRLAGSLRAWDATLVEINPLGEMPDGRLVALDTRVAIDDGALFRQPRFAEIGKGRAGGGALAARMKELEIQHVPIGGSIGLISSGAGAGVAIMDWVEREGGQVAGFVDLDYAIMSGKTEPAFRLVLDMLNGDPSVRSIIVNFTSCGLRLDRIAESFLPILAERRASLAKPLFFHMQGNRAPLAHRLLRGAELEVCESLGEAVRRAVSAARRVAV